MDHNTERLKTMWYGRETDKQINKTESPERPKYIQKLDT